ncbi:MAG: carbohydrate kinase, partial [Oscillospiraceae bacterium]|nr:carbohydrate kinase [Oscillospiraceae bacterium]
MGEPLVLTFDVGTQSVKALLIDRSGHIEAQAHCYYETPYYSRQPSWAEQDPELYFNKLCAASMELKERAPEAFDRAECVAVTVFRDSFVCLDREGKPLRDCILWMDQRKVKNPRPIPPVRQALFAAVGMWESAELLNRTCMCNWIVENEPEIWAETDKFVLLSTYLNLRMTGRLVDSWASQIAHIPFDYKNRCWDENGLTRCLYDIPTEKLCDLVPAGSQIGAITPACAADSGMREGLVLIATGSDKGCETLGL